MGIRKINRAIKKLEEFQLSLLFTELAQRLDRTSKYLDNLESSLARSYEPNLKPNKEVNEGELIVCNLNSQTETDLITEEKTASFNDKHEEKDHVKDEVKEDLVNIVPNIVPIEYDPVVTKRNNDEEIYFVEPYSDEEREALVINLSVNEEVFPNLSRIEINNTNLFSNEELTRISVCLDFQDKEPYQSPLDKSINKKLYVGDYQCCWILNSVIVDARDCLTISSMGNFKFSILVQGGRRGGRHEKRRFKRHKKKRFKKHTKRWVENKKKIWIVCIEDDELKDDLRAMLIHNNGFASKFVRFIFDPGVRWFKNRVDSF